MLLLGDDEKYFALLGGASGHQADLRMEVSFVLLSV